jgi:aminomethyltransferase
MRTPLYDRHAALGGRIIDFAGWELPVQYSSILEEHRAVRERAGVFDVSHMGELWVTGDAAFDFLQGLTTNDLSRLHKGRAVYSPICYEDGGTVDDLIFYPRQGGIFICCNAGNTDKDFAWISEHAPEGVTVENQSARYAQLALQGPAYAAVLEKLGASDVAALPFFGCGAFTVLGKPVFAAATGYTGERGVEFYLPPDDAEALWDALIQAGALPCGLGARDSLRLEAGLPLYGHELSRERSPVHAGLGRFVKPDKGEFLGRAALVAQLNDPETPRLVGLRSLSRAIPRADCEVRIDGNSAGKVTSGGPSPTLGGGIALALVRGGGESYGVVIRGREEPMALTAVPFYKAK